MQLIFSVNTDNSVDILLTAPCSYPGPGCEFKGYYDVATGHRLQILTERLLSSTPYHLADREQDWWQKFEHNSVRI